MVGSKIYYKNIIKKIKNPIKIIQRIQLWIISKFYLKIQPKINLSIKIKTINNKILFSIGITLMI